MDKKDKQIIAILREDSRFTTAQIAAMSGLSEDEVKDRIAAMEQSGIIAKYTVLCNIEKMDSDAVTALIEVKVTPQMRDGFDAIARDIYKFEEVKDVYLMSGSYDLTVIVEGKNLREVSRFVTERLSVLKDVTATATHFILKKYKAEGVVLEKREEIKREEIV